MRFQNFAESVRDHLDRFEQVDQLQRAAKMGVRRSRVQTASAELQAIRNLASDALKKQIDLAGERGALSWLTALPLRDHGFDLDKGTFRDSPYLRYGLTLPHLPPSCVCGSPFTVEHALSCARGGYPTLRHNQVRDLLADTMTEVAHDVTKEPRLQPLTGESFGFASASTDNEARLDVAARGFWGDQHCRAFFDVRMFNPFARSNAGRLSSVYRRHEQEKRRIYQERIINVEH